jgi:hypothetical protein
MREVCGPDKKSSTTHNHFQAKRRSQVQKSSVAATTSRNGITPAPESALGLMDPRRLLDNTTTPRVKQSKDFDLGRCKYPLLPERHVWTCSLTVAAWRAAGALHLQDEVRSSLRPCVCVCCEQHLRGGDEVSFVVLLTPRSSSSCVLQGKREKQRGSSPDRQEQYHPTATGQKAKAAGGHSTGSDNKPSNLSPIKEKERALGHFQPRQAADLEKNRTRVAFPSLLQGLVGRCSRTVQVSAFSERAIECVAAGSSSSLAVMS